MITLFKALPLVPLVEVVPALYLEVAVPPEGAGTTDTVNIGSSLLSGSAG
jgi:hypothetical protein